DRDVVDARGDLCVGADGDHPGARVPHGDEPVGSREPQVAQEGLAHRPPAEDRSVLEEEADVVARLARPPAEALGPGEARAAGRGRAGRRMRQPQQPDPEAVGPRAARLRLPLPAGRIGRVGKPVGRRGGGGLDPRQNARLSIARDLLGELAGHDDLGRQEAYASTTLRMCVATATTSPRWFVTVTRANDFRATSSRSTISYVTVTVSPMNTAPGKRMRSYPYDTIVPGRPAHIFVDAWDM